MLWTLPISRDIKTYRQELAKSESENRGLGMGPDLVSVRKCVCGGGGGGAIHGLFWHRVSQF